MKNITYFIQNIIWKIKTLYWNFKDYLINLYRISPETAEIRIVNYMLKPYNVDCDYVIKNPEINGVPWYQYYTFNSEEEYKRYKKYALKQYRKAYPYSNEKYINSIFSGLDLYCGLKRNYDEKF